MDVLSDDLMSCLIGVGNMADGPVLQFSPGFKRERGDRAVPLLRLQLGEIDAGAVNPRGVPVLNRRSGMPSAISDSLKRLEACSPSGPLS